MTVRDVIRTLVLYDMDIEVKLCPITSIGNPEEMNILWGIRDKYGCIPCEIHKEIEHIGLNNTKNILYIS